MTIVEIERSNRRARVTDLHDHMRRKMEWLTGSMEETATWLKAHADELAGTTKAKDSRRRKRSYCCFREVRELMDVNSIHGLPKRTKKVSKTGNRNEAQGTK